MHLKRKLEIVEQAVASITLHADEDAAVRSAALDRIIALATRDKEAIQAEIKRGIEATLGVAEPA